MSAEGWFSILRRRIDEKSPEIAGAKTLTDAPDSQNLNSNSEYVPCRPGPGRPPKTIDAELAQEILSVVNQHPRKSIRQVADEYGIDRRTLGRWIDNGRLKTLAERGVKE